MAFADSGDFAVDTRPNFRFYPNYPVAPQAGMAYADSAPFTVDSRPNFRYGKFADSSDFTLDTRGVELATALSGLVLESDGQGRSRGPLAGASVELSGVGVTTSDANGEFRFDRLSAGTYSITARKAGYYSVARPVRVREGELKRESIPLLAQSGSGSPGAFDFVSPNGRHFIAGMPGTLSFGATIAWNGSPGSVHFNIAGSRHPATVEDLGGGLARASLVVAAPATVSGCTELTAEVTNGEGKSSEINVGLHFSPVPGVVIPWYADNIPWTPSGLTLSYAAEDSRQWKLGWGDRFSLEPFIGFQRKLKYDLLAGTFSGSIGGFGGVGLDVDLTRFEVLGQGRLGLNGTLDIALAGCEPPRIVPGWEASLQGKIGAGAPVAIIVAYLFPPAVPVVDGLLLVPVVGEVVGALKVRVYFVFGGSLQGVYSGDEWGPCFLGTSKLSGALTFGFEGQSVVELFGAEAGFYAGGTGTPEWELCPNLEFESIAGRGYVGLFAKAFGFQRREEFGIELRFDVKDGQRLVPTAWKPATLSAPAAWQRIADSALQWGQANQVAYPMRGRILRTAALEGGSAAGEETVVTNVVSLASPSVLTDGAQTLVLFALHDPQKPWHSATDVAAVHRAGTNAWSLGRIADDQAAEFTPRLTKVEPGIRLAAWTRVSGDVSIATGPEQVSPHLEIVAVWQNSTTGNWNQSVQLTTNTVVDRDPQPVVFGATPGVVWIQNEGQAGVGNRTSGDRVMFANWNGAAWEAPQTLWAGPKGILGFAFVEDGAGEGHLVFAVDEDGDLQTRTDRELYRLSTVKGVWQPAIRLTADALEDSLPVLVAPKEAPVSVWSASNTLVYTLLQPWNPRPVFTQDTLANQAPTLDGVTLPGGAAIAYAVQGTNGVDLVASFYDAALDRWSLPRQLTRDEHVESALSLDFNGGELVIAYLKTLTVRTNVDVDIDGQVHRLQNIPQPGRTDLCVLRHALGDDLAVAPGSLRLDPPNPAPGSSATITAVIENRGDRPVQSVQVVFFDGDPELGGTAIGSAQSIAGALIGGATQQLAVVWTVPPGTNAHDLCVVVDPALAVEDRDRSNNSSATRAVLPDLTVDTCWSSEVSASAVALVARLVNAGAAPTGPFEVSWRLDARNGEEIGRSRIGPLAAGQVYEVAHLWDTSGRPFSSAFVPVFAVADGLNDVPEINETNNAYPQSVRVIPGWVPRLLGVEVRSAGSVGLRFEVSGRPASAFEVDGTESLSRPIQWQAELGAVITTNAAGSFEAQVPAQGGTRFYRIREAR